MHRIRLAALSLFYLGAATGLDAAPPAPPIRGLHLMAPKPEEVPLAVKFIQDALPAEGVNVLVLEFDYNFQFTKHPEVAEPGSLSADDVRKLVAACRQAGVRLIPQINLLGHQSWEKTTAGLLRSHPEFDETPGKYPRERRHLLPQLLPAPSRRSRRGLRPDRRTGRRLRGRRLSRRHGRGLPPRRGRLPALQG